MTIERPTLYIDNRRNKSLPLPPPFNNEDAITDLNRFLALTTKDIAPDAVFVVAGGDGTMQKVLQLGAKDIVYFGGGSAQTLYQGLRRQEPAKQLPEIDLLKSFKDSLISYEYYPPLYTQNNYQHLFAYLFGAGHLSIAATFAKENSLNRPFLNHHLSLSYIAAGLISLKNIAERTHPTEVSIDGRRVFTGQQFGALEIISVPTLATFSMKNNINQDKIRVLTLTSETERDLSAKYAMALVVGSLFDIDTAARLHLVDFQDAESITLTPDQKKTPNICLDGQLEHFPSLPLNVRRSEKPVTIVRYNIQIL